MCVWAVSMCDLLNLTKFISSSSEFCAAASHNCNELIEFRFPSCLGSFPIYFPIYFPFFFPILLSLCSALKFDTLFLFIRFTAVLIPASVVSHLSRPFAKQNMYYLLRGTHTANPLPLTPCYACSTLSKKGLTATPPVRTFVGLLFFWAIQFGFPFHSNHF